MVLEPMAESTIGIKESIERDKFRTGLRGRLGKRKREEGDEKELTNEGQESTDIGAGDGGEVKETAVKKKKIRGPKAPNPLSVKKPKKDTVRAQEGDIEPSNFGTKEPEDHTKTAGGIIEPNPDNIQAPSGKRKRKRQHRPGKLADLKDVLAGNEDSSC